MKISFTTLLLVLAGMLMINSCTPRLNPYAIYRPIPVDDVYKLQGDSVHRTQVESLFGQPLRRAINERGDVYTYSYFGDSLFIQFNREQLVNRFNFQPEAFSLDFENQQNTNRRFRDSQLRRIIPGTTPLNELTSRFGSPNRGETGTVRYRTTFFGRQEELVVYSQPSNGMIISYELQPRN